MEWLRQMQWLGWIGGALVLGLVEVLTLDLVFMMLVVAALAASAVAFLGGSFTIQVITFVVAATLLLAVVRPIALRKLKPAQDDEVTGAAAGVGRSAHVLATVTDRAGLVKLRGEEWTARSAHRDEVFEVGTDVQVVRIDGATAVVESPTTRDPGGSPGSSGPADHPPQGEETT